MTIIRRPKALPIGQQGAKAALDTAPPPPNPNQIHLPGTETPTRVGANGADEIPPWEGPSEGEIDAVETELKAKGDPTKVEVKHLNKKGELPPPAFSGSMSRVIETVVAKAQKLLDDPATFERLERALKVEGAGTPEQVRQALNLIHETAADAHLVMLAAKSEFERWEHASRVYEGPMRDAAVKSLQADKASGKMSKVIGEADIRARIAKLFPDEYRAQEDNRLRAEMVVKQFERVAELLAKRDFALGNMLPGR